MFQLAIPFMSLFLAAPNVSRYKDPSRAEVRQNAQYMQQLFVSVTDGSDISIQCPYGTDRYCVPANNFPLCSTPCCKPGLTTVWLSDHSMNTPNLRGADERA